MTAQTANETGTYAVSGDFVSDTQDNNNFE